MEHASLSQPVSEKERYRKSAENIISIVGGNPNYIVFNNKSTRDSTEERLAFYLEELVNSRLKQVEAERDSYRKDAKMLDSFVKTLTNRITELSWYDKRDYDAVNALIRNTALSSLSNQYPSSK